jgi:hypothetical protein
MLRRARDGRQRFGLLGALPSCSEFDEVSASGFSLFAGMVQLV